RGNGGGSPEMVALVCSYLFGAEPVHLNDLYWREGNRTDEFWTRKEVVGKRYLNKDVYVLTSKRTFSGAEEFTYNLKNLKRATIIGETTGGGAHPGGGFRINEHFSMFVPSGRAISPITKTNWEGTGVKPDIEVPSDQALLVARLTALKKSANTLTNPDFKAGVQEVIQELEKELTELKAKK
ncbi:MAG: S41 family peptidase, partial [Pyrinomonadaceae bacterium]|nr:S41 family peptidase [Pyrinomonadaceae bacterium]